MTHQPSRAELHSINSGQVGAPTISILGLGNWGTAIANHLASKNIPITAWSKNTAIVESINNSNKNPKYQKETTLNLLIKATSDLTLALESEWIILAIPSHALSDLLNTTGEKLLSKKIISGIKGFSEDANLTTLQTLENYNKTTVSVATATIHNINSCVLAGPCFASDLVAGRPASIVIASHNPELAKSAAQIFSSPILKAYTSADPIGAELGGAIKNVIAIAAGISDGMKFGDSAKAGIITRGLAEMTRLGVALGAKRETFSGLTGLGDLAMTATSDLSRNRVVGVRLGKGEKLNDILQSLGSVAEGVRSSPFILKLAQSVNVEMPITEAVNSVVEGKSNIQDAVRGLMIRPMKEE